MITRNADGVYNKRNCLEKSEQINCPEGFKCIIRLEAQFYSTRFESDHFHFSKDTINIDDLYRLLGMTFNASTFDVGNSLARCFNFESAMGLFDALAKRIMTNKQLMSINMRVWSTALIVTCIKILCQKFQSEWTLPVNSLEQWISSQVHYIDVEKRLYDFAKKFVMDRFNINISEELENLLHPSGNCFSPS